MLICVQTPELAASLEDLPAGAEVIAWDGTTGRIAWSKPEPFSVWAGALATAGGIVFYGTLEGYLKAVDARTGRELYRFRTPSGIVGNVTSTN